MNVWRKIKNFFGSETSLRDVSDMTDSDEKPILTIAGIHELIEKHNIGVLASRSNSPITTPDKPWRVSLEYERDDMEVKTKGRGATYEEALRESWDILDERFWLMRLGTL